MKTPFFHTFQVPSLMLYFGHSRTSFTFTHTRTSIFLHTALESTCSPCFLAPVPPHRQTRRSPSLQPDCEWVAQVRRNLLGHRLRQSSSFLDLIKRQTLPDTLKSQGAKNFCLQARFFFYPFLFLMCVGKKQGMYFFFYGNKCYFSFLNQQPNDFITKVQTESTAMHIYGKNKQNPQGLFSKCF